MYDERRTSNASVETDERDVFWSRRWPKRRTLTRAWKHALIRLIFSVSLIIIFWPIYISYILETHQL